MRSQERTILSAALDGRRGSVCVQLSDGSVWQVVLPRPSAGQVGVRVAQPEASVCVQPCQPAAAKPPVGACPVSPDERRVFWEASAAGSMSGLFAVLVVQWSRAIVCLYGCWVVHLYETCRYTAFLSVTLICVLSK